MENFAEIKTEFVEYLKEKYKNDSSSKIDSYTPELSIFMYSSDFQHFLVDEGYADKSVFSQTISEIKEMLTSDDENIEENSDDNFILTALTDLFNQDEELFDVVNTNSDDTIDNEEMIAFLDSIEETNETQETPETEETQEVEETGEMQETSAFDEIAKGIQNIKENSESAVNDMLDSIYNNEKALDYLDLDKDGKINDLEKELFESFIQGDKDELEPEDLKKALEEMEEGTFEYDVKLPEDAISVKDIPETVAAQSNDSTDNISARQTSNPTQSLSPTGRTSGGSRAAGNTPQQTTPSDPKDMNLEQLKTEQGKRQTAVDSAKEGVDNTLSEIDNVKENEYPEAKEAYDKAVENDENIDEELKTRRSENLEAIETVSNEVDTLNSQISQTEVSLGQANDKLDGDNKTLAALQSALASYSDVSSDDTEAAAQKAQIQEQINTLEQTTIPQDKQSRDELEEKLNNDKDSLEKKEEELSELQTTRSEIEEEIAQNGSEDTKKALENFQEVEQKLDELRAKLPDAQEKLKTAQQDLTEINELIRTKEAQDTESENSYYSGNLPAELVSALDGKLGAGFCKKLEEVAKNINCDPADLIGMMQSESGINPQAYNGNGGATGLIQFMPSTAQNLGTSTNELLNMSAIEQLDYVEKYFTNFTGGSGQRLTGGDLYTLCFLPAFLNNEVLCSSSDPSTSLYYNANSGLDANGDGSITKSELQARVTGKYQEVLSQYGAG